MKGTIQLNGVLMTLHTEGCSRYSQLCSVTMAKQLQKLVKIIKAKPFIFMQMNILGNDDFASFSDNGRLYEKYEYKRRGNVSKLNLDKDLSHLNISHLGCTTSKPNSKLSSQVIFHDTD